jgi:predicted dehydrogenase
MFKVSIFGCGGRILNLLNNDLPKILDDYKIDISEFKIVAIYDPMIHYLISILGDKFSNFKRMISDTKLYIENEEKVYDENDFDVSIIASRNDVHFSSLILANKYHKNIFCEKPIVNSIEQISSLIDNFKLRNNKLFFQTGLTLRYSKICTEAKKYLSQIGNLLHVDGCELLNIGHGGQIIMKNWRRSKSISGGLGLEKCIHDYDLIFHFIESVFMIKIDNVEIKSTAQNTFWIPSRREEIMAKIESDKELSESYHKWDKRIFQRVVEDPFEYSPDLIPDQQQVEFKIKDIIINFDISIGSFRTKTERIYHFFGTKGDCIIDMVKLTITLLLRDQDPQYIELLEKDTYSDSHAGGDYFVMKQLIDLMMGLHSQPHNMTEIIPFDDAIRSTIIGCLAENSIDFGTQLYSEG